MAFAYEVFDASRFGGIDTEVVVAYSVDLDIAAYLPPVRLRETAWRSGIVAVP